MSKRRKIHVARRDEPSVLESKPPLATDDPLETARSSADGATAAAAPLPPGIAKDRTPPPPPPGTEDDRMPPPPPPPPPTEETEETVESLRAKVDELSDRLLRSKAEIANVQRRAATERVEAVRFGQVDLLRPILGVVDDLERTLAVELESDEARSVLCGVRLVYDNLMKVLREQGVEAIEAVGTTFDPNVHEAMMRRPSADHEPGVVLEEVVKGYRLRDRVIRPTRVIVSSPPIESGPENGDAERDVPSDAT